MRHMAIARLVSLSAKQIHAFYSDPKGEKKFEGLHKNVAEAGADTDRFLSVSSMATVRGKDYYITFDEVILKGDIAYCIMRKEAKNLDQSKVLVGCLASVFNQSLMRLSTVKRLVEAGYKRRVLDLTTYDCVFVLAFGSQLYDVVADEDSCLQWLHAKMNAADSKTASAAFDRHPLPEVVTWEMEEL